MLPKSGFGNAAWCALESRGLQEMEARWGAGRLEPEHTACQDAPQGGVETAWDWCHLPQGVQKSEVRCQSEAGGLCAGCALPSPALRMGLACLLRTAGELQPSLLRTDLLPQPRGLILEAPKGRRSQQSGLYIRVEGQLGWPRLPQRGAHSLAGGWQDL